jgi:hypothetical protein
MSKPTELPEWGTTSTNITDPPLSYKQPGFPTGAQVPSGVLNWLLFTIYSWILWLSTFESTAHTWSAVQTFSTAPALPAGVTGPVAATGAVSGSSLSTGGTLGVTGTSTLGTVNTSGVLTASNSIKPNAGLDLSSAPTPATVTNSKTLNARNVVRGMARIQHSAAFGSSTAAATYNCTLSGTDGTTYTTSIDMNEDMGTNLFVQVTDFDTAGGSNNYVTRVKNVSTVGGKTRITLNTTKNGADTATGNTNCGYYLTVWSMN